MLEASTDKLHSLVESAVETMAEESSTESQVGVAMLICEMKDPETGITAFYTFCTDKREWVQRGVLSEATMAVDHYEAEVPDGD